MKANPYISNKEKWLLTIIASIVFSLTLINLGSIVIEDYNKSVQEEQERLLRLANGDKISNGIDFSICGFPRISLVPHFRFFSILILLILLLEKRFIFSTLCAFLGFSAFSYENFSRIRYYFENEIDLPLLKIIEFIARPLDYLVFLLISVLLFWQISILLRILITSQQRKIGLP